jgi:hypothetical protein
MEQLVLETRSHTKSYGVKNLALEVAKVLAYRVIEDAIAIGAFGMGPPIHVWIMRSIEGQNKIEELSEP